MHIPRGPTPVSLEYRDDVMYSSFAIFHTERQRATPPQFIIKYRSAGGRARRPECRDELDFTVSHLVLLYRGWTVVSILSKIILK